MKNKNMEIKVIGNDSMEGMIEVEKFSGYEMLKVVCDIEEGEGEMNKKRFKEDWEEVRVNKELIICYCNNREDWIGFINVKDVFKD